VKLSVRRISLWLPLVAYMAAIFYVSGQSDPFPSIAPLFWDKAVHFTEYGLLGLLWCRALRGEGVSWLPALALALVATIGYGATDEWHQSFVAMRTSDIHDWLADAIGGSTGLAIYAGFGALGAGLAVRGARSGSAQNPGPHAENRRVQ
jgi:VanZ family protein